MDRLNHIIDQVDVNSVLDGSPSPMVILDRDMRVTYMNGALAALSGISFEKARGLPCAHVLRNNLCMKECPAKASIREGKKVQADGNIITHERELVPVRVTASPLLDKEGGLLGVIETVEDVSIDSELYQRGPLFEEFGELVGHSAPMEKIKAVLPVIAGTDSSVLITGETGTGKDLIASIVHRLSPRSQGAFIKVNCGALPESLLESELFGHVRGAFTGADRDKPGRFQLADGGTVYLTEIGDLHLPLQVKLLSFLDDKEVTPLGGTRSIKTDVRIMAATHRDLEAMVEEGTFRKDLLFRLNVVRLDVTPVRERGEDRLLLLEHFLNHFRDKIGKDLEGFSDQALEMLKAYPFPGNVREIRNVVEYAASICPAGKIQITHLPEYLRDYRGEVRVKAPARGSEEAPAAGSLSRQAADERMDWSQMERVMINEALIRSRGNRTKAAEILGWGRSTLWRKMKKHGMS